MSTRTLSAWGSLLIAILLWAGFGLLVWQLSEERARYASLKADVALQEGRDKASAELRGLIRDTKDEREALEQLSRTDVLAAAATIEAVGIAAGARVSIESAASTSLGGKQTKDIGAIVVVAHAEGTFQSLIQAAALFESLPFPSMVENYEMQASPRSSGRGDSWSMTARIRIMTSSNTGA